MSCTGGPREKSLHPPLGRMQDNHKFMRELVSRHLQQLQSCWGHEGHVGEHFAVDAAACFFQTGDELAIGQPIDLGTDSDADDPEAFKISFLLFAVAIIECHR